MLTLAIKELKNRGYEFVTISEMSELKGTMLDYDTTYFGFQLHAKCVKDT